MWTQLQDNMVKTFFDAQAMTACTLHNTFYAKLVQRKMHSHGSWSVDSSEDISIFSDIFLPFCHCVKTQWRIQVGGAGGRDPFERKSSIFHSILSGKITHLISMVGWSCPLFWKILHPPLFYVKTLNGGRNANCLSDSTFYKEMFTHCLSF